MKNNLETPAKKHKYPIRVIMEAVTYRVPLPVTKVIAYTSSTYPVCPRCALSLEREYMAFCDRCGQRLNWDFFEYAKIYRPGSKKE